MSVLRRRLTKGFKIKEPKLVAITASGSYGIDTAYKYISFLLIGAGGGGGGGGGSSYSSISSGNSGSDGGDGGNTFIKHGNQTYQALGGGGGKAGAGGAISGAAGGNGGSGHGSGGGGGSHRWEGDIASGIGGSNVQSSIYSQGYGGYTSGGKAGTQNSAGGNGGGLGAIAARVSSPFNLTAVLASSLTGAYNYGGGGGGIRFNSIIYGLGGRGGAGYQAWSYGAGGGGGGGGDISAILNQIPIQDITVTIGAKGTAGSGGRKPSSGGGGGNSGIAGYPGLVLIFYSDKEI